jgi:hypothetical protein
VGVAIVGAWFAYGQLLEISAQTQLQARALSDTRKIAAANLFLEFRKRLDDPKYADLVKAVQSNKPEYRIVKDDDDTAKSGGIF